MFSVILINYMLALVFFQPGQPAIIGGTYAYGKNIEKGPVGKLLVVPQTDTSFLFYLDVSRGAPSYNMGQKYGRAFFQSSTGKWKYRKGDSTSACSLSFSFQKGRVIISTINSEDDCGFGYGIVADGKYKLASNKIPTYFITPTEDTVYFAASSPEE